MREKPTSNNRKPACMNRTRQAATTTHVVSTAGTTSLSVVAASMTGSLGAARESVFRPRYRIRVRGFVRREGLRSSAAADPVVDEIAQFLRRVRLLDLLCRDGSQRHVQCRLAIDHDRLT